MTHDNASASLTARMMKGFVNCFQTSQAKLGFGMGSELLPYDNTRCLRDQVLAALKLAHSPPEQHIYLSKSDSPI